MELVDLVEVLIIGKQMLLIQTQETIVCGNWTQGGGSLILDMKRLEQNKKNEEKLCKELDDYNKRI